MPALDIKLLEDIGALREKRSRDLRALGRLPYPMVRRRGDPGFRRVGWEEALSLAATSIKASRPERLYFYLTSRGVPNETYYAAQKAARALGTNNIDNAARGLSLAQHICAQSGLGRGGDYLLLQRPDRHRSGGLFRKQCRQQPAGHDEVSLLRPEGRDEGGRG
jgi:Molybdopterin oxidoreductase